MKDIFDEQGEEEEVEEGEGAELDPIEQAFVDGNDEGKDPEDIKHDMVKAGAKFGGLDKLFNKMGVQFGYITNRKERVEIVEECLKGKDISTEESLDAAISAVGAATSGVSSQAVRGLIRSYAKKYDVDIFVAPKTEPGGPRNTIRNQFRDYIKTNLDCTEADAVAFIKEHGSEAANKNIKRYISEWQFAMDVKTLVQK